MTVQTREREHQRLLKVAREYRQRGYDVLIEPRPDQMPDFLAPFRIDILARSSQENVVVEVRNKTSLTVTPDLDAIAQALHDKSSWRFELVVTNPKDPSELEFKDAKSLNPPDISYRLHEARQLAEHEHGEAALLLAWSATEALLRYIAELEGISVSQSNPSQVAKSLFVYGALDKEPYETLLDGIQARNRVVHGYKERPALANTVAKLLDTAERLQRQYAAS